MAVVNLHPTTSRHELRQANQTYAEIITAQAAHIDGLEQSNHTYEGMVAGQTALVGALMTSLGAANDQIVQLGGRAGELEVRVARLQDDLAGEAAALAAARAQVAEDARRTTEAQAQVAALRAENAQLTEQLAALTRRIEELVALLL